MKKYNIFYIGADPQTLNILVSARNFNVLSVNYLWFFSKQSLNPFNLFFKYLYFKRLKKEEINKLDLLIWSIVRHFLTSVFSKYSEYFDTILTHDIRIIDVDKTDDCLQHIIKSGVDLNVVNVWPILSDTLIFAPKYKTINIHPSKLPKYRGSLPTLWALKNEDSSSAVTYIVLEKKMDSGSIINQHQFNIEKKDNWLNLENKILDILKQTLVKDILSYLNGDIHIRMQDFSASSFTGKYETYKRILFSEEKAKDIYNKTNLYPYLEDGVFCFFVFRNRKIYVKKIELSDLILDLKIGHFQISGLKIFFMTNQGALTATLFKDIAFKDSLLLFLCNPDRIQ